jgi:RNA polymerase sigma factor (sigma-70 family)
VPKTDWQESSDAELIAASITEPERFAPVFDRHYTDIARYLLRRLERSEAEEVAADAFVLAFSKRAAYDQTRASARPWLFGIAANLARRQRRSELARLRAYAKLDRQEEPDHSEAALDRLHAQGSRAALLEALVALPEREREVLLLISWGGLSYPEVAVALDIPGGSVRSRLSRARARLQAAVSDRADPPQEVRR